MIANHDWDRLVRYITGECDPAEARETLRWIHADPERVRAADELSGLHRVGGSVPGRWNVDAAWQKVAVPPPGSGRVARLVPVFSHVRRSSPWIGRIAAAIVAVGSAAVFWYFVLAAHDSTLSTGSVAMQEIVTRRGQLLKLNLSDGSRITLAAASRIRYARNFGVPGQPRDIYLQGRALFDVTHDQRRPFRVHTDHTVTEDIGTRFVVAAYAGDSADRVAVVEGVVALRDGHEASILKRGDIGTATRTMGLRILRGADLGADTSWAGGRLVFRDTPLRDVILELARWYDVDIRLANPVLGDRLLTAVFADMPRDAALADLARTLRLRSERTGPVVWLSQR